MDRLDMLVQATRDEIVSCDNEKKKQILRDYLDYILTVSDYGMTR